MNAGFFWGVALLLGAISFVSRGAQTREPESEFPGWPPGLVPTLAVPLVQSLHPAQLTGGSPFVRICLDGDTTWVVRWLPRVSRSAHPAIDCFRGQGYSVGEVRTVDVSGVRWQEFIVARDRSTWRVRQRWVGTGGHAWSDVSSWFWANRTEGSAFTVVTVTPERETLSRAELGTGPFPQTASWGQAPFQKSRNPLYEPPTS